LGVKTVNNEEKARKEWEVNWDKWGRGSCYGHKNDRSLPGNWMLHGRGKSKEE
jgi:hypothetical protein